jgi:hypothetical protein
MGFTISPKTVSQQTEKQTVIDHNAVQTGYLEVSSPASYSLTAGY